MITILHGENVAASRKELEKLRAEPDEVVVLDGKTITETDFIQATQSTSFLGEKRLVVVENFFSGKKKINLDLKNVTSEVVFWEDKKINAAGLSAVKVLEFKTEPVVFKFLDNLLATPVERVRLYRQASRENEPEYLFLMLVRQFRLMLNPKNLAPWQASKISRQAKILGIQKIKEVYRQLLEIDYQNKTGQLVGDLNLAIELFLLNL